MGVGCFKTTPAKVYNSFLQVDNLRELKEQWPPIKLFKLKRIFEANCQMHPRTRQKCLPLAAFLSLMLQFDEQKFNSYRDENKKRLFDLFDNQGEGYLTWANFFAGVTLCQYGSEQILSILLFALFDKDLKLALTRNEIIDLVNLNSKYLKEDTEFNEIIDDESITDGLLMHTSRVNLQDWIEQSPIFLDYEKFRKLFNIFVQEEMEKEMASNFGEINSLWNEEKEKYVGYVVNYKWFEGWKTYLHKEYGIQLEGFTNNLTYLRTMKTLKSMKTKKTIKSIKSTKSLKSTKTLTSARSNKKPLDYPKLREIPNLTKDINENMTQYNLIYGNIGDRPAEINNNLLEGQFSEILAPELVENIHYILVSEEVWRRLKLIYGGYPQFRRSGETAIQIYPKTFRIYSRFYHGKIDYNEQKICEFSKTMQMDNLISKAYAMDISNLSDYSIFYKTCSILKWQQVLDITIRVSEISSEQLVFLALVLKQEMEEFKEVNCKVAETIKEIHLGDEFLYADPIEGTTLRAIFMSKTKNKMVVHFRGLSHIYDLCLEKEIFYERASLGKRQTESQRHKVRIQQLQMVGLPNSKGLSYVNSLLLSLFSNQNFIRALYHYQKDAPSNLVEHLAYLYHMLTNSYRVNISLIGDIMRNFFSQFASFEFTMCELFTEQFITSTDACFKELGGLNAAQEYKIYSQKSTICHHCHREQLNKETFYVLGLPIPQEQVKYYEIIYVPFAYSLKSVEMKRYGFTLASGSTFQNYKQAFERVADLKNTPYVLVQIHGDCLLKNYLNARPEATLTDLLLREEDRIYAYELCLRLDNFINDHYWNDSMPKLRDLRVGQMIDFEKDRTKKITTSRKRMRIDEKKESDRIMTFGKILSIQMESYTHKTILKIEHRQNRGEILQSSICPDLNPIAIFPTKSYLHCQQYHIRLIQRFYNQVSNEMQTLSMPFIIMIASWMRLKQLELIVYQQVRGLIHDDYKFRVAEESYSPEEGMTKVSKKEKIKKFREYLYEGNTPYEIKFNDLEGRCSVCCKIQKTHVLDHEEEFTCPGCELDPDIPIFWQIRPYQTRICVDWRAAGACLKPCVVDHSSYTITRSARKNCVQGLQDCLKLRLSSQNEDCCCSFSKPAQSTSTQTLSAPNRLLILFDRIIEQQLHYKHINRKYIHFEIDEMEFSGEIYQLIAATSIEGSQLDARYATYMREKNHWLEYNGESVRTVKKTALQKICALSLHYRKIGSKAQKNNRV